VVVLEQAIQKVDRGVVREVGVVGCHEFRVWPPRVPPDECFELRVQLDAVLAQVGVQVVRAQHARDLGELVVVVVAVEKGFAPKDEAGERGAQGPHVEAVVVVLQVDEEFRALQGGRRWVGVRGVVRARRSSPPPPSIPRP
jgi:hypothetical protein